MRNCPVCETTIPCSKCRECGWCEPSEHTPLKYFLEGDDIPLADRTKLWTRLTEIAANVHFQLGGRLGHPIVTPVRTDGVSATFALWHPAASQMLRTVTVPLGERTSLDLVEMTALPLRDMISRLPPSLALEALMATVARTPQNLGGGTPLIADDEEESDDLDEGETSVALKHPADIKAAADAAAAHAKLMSGMPPELAHQLAKVKKLARDYLLHHHSGLTSKENSVLTDLAKKVGAAEDALAHAHAALQTESLEKLPFEADWHSPDGGFSRVWLSLPDRLIFFMKRDGIWRRASELSATREPPGRQISAQHPSIREIVRKFYVIEHFIPAALAARVLETLGKADSPATMTPAELQPHEAEDPEQDEMMGSGIKVGGITVGVGSDRMQQEMTEGAHDLYGWYDPSAKYHPVGIAKAEFHSIFLQKHGKEMGVGDPELMSDVALMHAALDKGWVRIQGHTGYLNVQGKLTRAIIKDLQGRITKSYDRVAWEPPVGASIVVSIKTFLDSESPEDLKNKSRDQWSQFHEGTEHDAYCPSCGYHYTSKDHGVTRCPDCNYDAPDGITEGFESHGAYWIDPKGTLIKVPFGHDIPYAKQHFPIPDSDVWQGDDSKLIAYLVSKGYVAVYPGITLFEIDGQFTDRTLRLIQQHFASASPDVRVIWLYGKRTRAARDLKFSDLLAARSVEDLLHPRQTESLLKSYMTANLERRFKDAQRYLKAMQSEASDYKPFDHDAWLQKKIADLPPVDKKAVDRLVGTVRDPFVYYQLTDGRFIRWPQHGGYIMHSDPDLWKDGKWVRVTGGEQYSLDYKKAHKKAQIFPDELKQHGLHESDGTDINQESRGTEKYKAAVALISKPGLGGDTPQILLGKRRDDPTGKDDMAGYLVFPGGGIDPEDGNDPFQAAQREAYEETGCQVLPQRTIDHPDKPEVAFVVCAFLGGKPEPNEEFVTLDWYNVREAADNPDVYPQNRQILYRLLTGPTEAITENITSGRGWVPSDDPDHSFYQIPGGQTHADFVRRNQELFRISDLELKMLTDTELIRWAVKQGWIRLAYSAGQMTVQSEPTQSALRYVQKHLGTAKVVSWETPTGHVQVPSVQVLSAETFSDLTRRVARTGVAAFREAGQDIASGEGAPPPEPVTPGTPPEKPQPWPEIPQIAVDRSQAPNIQTGSTSMMLTFSSVTDAADASAWLSNMGIQQRNDLEKIAVTLNNPNEVEIVARVAKAYGLQLTKGAAPTSVPSPEGAAPAQ